MPGDSVQRNPRPYSLTGGNHDLNSFFEMTYELAHILLLTTNMLAPNGHIMIKNKLCIIRYKKLFSDFCFIYA